MEDNGEGMVVAVLIGVYALKEDQRTSTSTTTRMPSSEQ
jgi:hypothetical protein